MREDIDSGATGEKVPGPDPAAAPLGTDAEAGGASQTLAERKLEAASRRQITGSAPQPSRQSRWVAVALVLVFVGILTAMFSFAGS